MYLGCKIDKEEAMDIVFVILHYNTIDETRKCAASIAHSFYMTAYKIIIIDNDSPNRTGIELAAEYKDNDKIDVIIAPNNLGFAKGNNLGIEMARKMEPKYICCTNNDTVFEQLDFFEQLDVEYNKSKAAVIGPMVIRKNGEIQKYDRKIKTMNEYEKELYTLLHGDPILITIKKALIQFPGVKAIRDCVFRKDYKEFPGCFLERREHIVLHGCCLIFTKEFFDVYQGFYDKTFMYKEEELLYLMAEKEKLNMVYCPSLRVRHLEDAATVSVYRTSKTKNKFRREMQAESIKILMEYMENIVKDGDSCGK